MWDPAAERTTSRGCPAAPTWMIAMINALRPISPRFVLHVVDRNGLPIDADYYHLTSLTAATWVGHVLQEQDGCTVTILDLGETPHKIYGIDEAGNAVPV